MNLIFLKVKYDPMAIGFWCGKGFVSIFEFAGRFVIILSALQDICFLQCSVFLYPPCSTVQSGVQILDQSTV